MKKCSKIIIILVTFCLFLDIVHANIVCNDGSVSPSCSVCSRGCCSRHGGCSSYSSSSTKKRKTTIKAPSKVENLRIVGVGTNNIKLKWNKVSSTGYIVYMNNKKVATIKNNKTITYNKTKLKANKSYSFKVRAYKKSGGKTVYGKYSNVASAKTAPSKSKITISNKDFESLNIKVNSVKGAIKYKLQRSTDKKTYETIIILEDNLKYIDSSLKTGKTYYYRVKACNINDDCSGWSSISSKKVLPSSPIFNIESTVTNKINITINNVDNIDGYEVYRSLYKNGTYSKIKTIKDDNLSFNNSTKKGYTYYYKVRSYMIINNKKVYSPYSKIKSIKSK